MNLASSGTNPPEGRFPSAPLPARGAAHSRPSGFSFPALTLLIALCALPFLAACAPEEPDDNASAAPQQVATVAAVALPASAPAPTDSAQSATADNARSDDATPAEVPPRPAVDSPYADRFATDGEVSVMTFNVHQYGLRSDPADPAVLVPKPPPEAAAIVETIRLASPDILILQEMGGPDAWAEFRFRLREAGLTAYAYDAYLRRGRHDLNLALLSRYPIVANNSHVDDTYTIGPAQFPVMRGFLDVVIQITPDYSLHILGAHLKSKVFHSFGSPEMRRNEARLLGNHVRNALRDNPDDNLLVLGDFNDDFSSAPLRNIMKEKSRPILFDLRPTDASGAAWTHRDASDTYTRIDYILVSAGLLPEAIPEKIYIPEALHLPIASDHRPLVATFIAAERSPDAPLLDISTRIPPSLPTND